MDNIYLLILRADYFYKLLQPINFLPAGCVWSAQLVGPKITWRFPCLFIYLCVRNYHAYNNYITYIVAMQPYLY